MKEADGSELGVRRRSGSCGETWGVLRGRRQLDARSVAPI